MNWKIKMLDEAIELLEEAEIERAQGILITLRAAMEEDRGNEGAWGVPCTTPITVQPTINPPFEPMCRDQIVEITC